jgi:uncharacterized protein (AIM24 family)
MKQKTKFGGFGRMLSGESIVKSTWTNSGSAPGFVSLTPNEPGNIIPINLDQEGGSMKCKKGKNKKMTCLSAVVLCSVKDHSY